MLTVVAFIDCKIPRSLQPSYFSLWKRCPHGRKHLWVQFWESFFFFFSSFSAKINFHLISHDNRQPCLPKQNFLLSIHHNCVIFIFFFHCHWTTELSTDVKREENLGNFHYFISGKNTVWCSAEAPDVRRKYVKWKWTYPLHVCDV